jgi:hypothetical protein
MESGLYQPENIQKYFNDLFISSVNGLQFLRCGYNNATKKMIFRVFSFWIDGYLTLMVNNQPVRGGGVYDEYIINPQDPYGDLIVNPFYKPDCSFILDFTSDESISRPVYRNLGWVMGFTQCQYTIDNDSCYIYYGNPYYDFYTYLKLNNPVNNILYLQQYFDINTAELLINGAVHAENIIVNTTTIPNSGVYVFLDIDDFNRNYDPTSCMALSDEFDSSFSASTFAKINLSTAFSYIDNSMGRTFFGPVNIKKMHIRLLNQYGEICYLPCDYSFTLRFTRMY